VGAQWERYLGVLSRAFDGLGRSHTPLGDPARWGAHVESLLTGGTGTFVLPAQQLCRAETVDPYARVWLLTGTMTATAEAWAQDDATWIAGLEVTAGIGQNTLVQTFNLRALVALAAPYYVDAVAGDAVTKAWCISGAVYGKAVNVRAVHKLVNSELVASPVGVSCNLAAVAAGYPL
jgi:hypothetical protein